MVSFLAIISAFEYISCIKRVALRTITNRQNDDTKDRQIVFLIA